VNAAVQIQASVERQDSLWTRRTISVGPCNECENIPLSAARKNSQWLSMNAEGLAEPVTLPQQPLIIYCLHLD
jgi:hypothetical protein